MDFGNFSISALIASFIYGVIGLYLVRRARSDANFPRLLIGVALMVYPYFIQNIYLIWGLGAGLLLLAYKLD